MAITEYYVDPGGGDDTTGDGSIGTPWASLAKALSGAGGGGITRDATNGDRINLKAGTSNVLGAALSTTSYGTPTATAPLVVQGYTSAAGDGGIGVIDGDGSYAIWNDGAKDFIHLFDLRMTNVGANTAVGLRDYCTIARCQIDTGTGNQALYLRRESRVLGCYIYGNWAARALFVDSGVYAYNHIVTSNHGIVPYATSRPIIIVGNAILITSNHGNGISTGDCDALISGNSIYKSGEAPGANYAGINLSGGGNLRYIVFSNVVCGWSGTGNAGIKTAQLSVMAGRNAFYNNTAATSYAVGPFANLGADVTLAALPWTDAANGDWSLTAAAKTALASLGYPEHVPGTSTDMNLTIGAVQQALAAAGGGFPKIASLLGRNRM